MYHDDGSNDERGFSMDNNDERIYHRYSDHQLQRLEQYFRDSPYPNDSQRRRLSEELNLHETQIKFWFQNKRTQAKARHEKSDNTILRLENRQLREKNAAMEEAMKSVVCPPCGGPRIGKEEREHSLQKLRLENALLKKEYKRLTGYLPIQAGHSVPSVDALAYQSDPEAYAFSSHGSSWSQLPEPQLQNFPPPSQMETRKMNETAGKAVAEVMPLIRIDEPLWFKSPVDGRAVIEHESYHKFFKNTSLFKSRSGHVESSKEVVVVQMNAVNLIEHFLDTEKWARLFPTIVNEARTIRVMEPMDGQNLSKVMYEKLHILSPLVQPREFVILRSCKQVEQDLWVIADVSYNLPYVVFEYGTPTCFKRPSGCLIQALPDGRSKVTWMEHVQVDDIEHAHSLYKDVLCSGSGYGARRWTVTLERMCERLSLSSISVFPTTDHRGVVHKIEGRRCIMRLGERMSKDFARILKMSKEVDFSQQPESNSGVRQSVRTSMEEGQPAGLIFSAISSLCLPVPPVQVYNLLTDMDVRHKWDVLCHGNPVAAVARFATGAEQKNCVAILRPSTKAEDGELRIIQDCFMDALGGMVVYSPIDLNTACQAVSGQVDPSSFLILPSGFTISPHDRLSAAQTLLTVAFQVFASAPGCAEDRNMREYAADVDTLVTATVKRIKAMLHCGDAHV